MARPLELIIKGDNRSAIRALKGVADQSNKTGEQVRRDSRTASGSFDEMGRSAHRLRDSIGGLAGMVGLGGLAFGIKDLVQGGLSLQASQTQVGNALAGVGIKGRTAAAVIRSIGEESAQMSTHGGGSLTQLNSGMARLIGVTHNMSAAQQAQRAAVALSVKTGMDYQSTLQMILSAEAGRTRGIAKYIGVITPVTTAQQKLADQHKGLALQERAQLVALTAQSKMYGKLGPQWLAQQKLTLAQQYATQGSTKAQVAQAAAADKVATGTAVVNRVLAVSRGAHESMSQKIQDTRHSFQNLTDEMGLTFLPIVNKVVGAVTVSVEWLNKHRAVLYGLLGAVSAVSGVLLAHKAIMAAVDAKNIILRASNMLLGTSFNAVKADAVEATAAIRGEGAQAVITAAENDAAAGGTAAGGAAAGGAAAVGGGAAALSVGGVAAVLTAFAAPTIVAKLFGGKQGVVKGAPERFGYPVAETRIGGPLMRTSGVGAPAGYTWAGGHLVPQYHAMGGPIGTDTVPSWLTPGEGVVTPTGMSRIGGEQGLNAINSGNGFGGGQRDIVIHVPLTVDGRKLAEAVTRVALNRAARGPTSLVGGSLVTGSSGLPVSSNTGGGVF